MTNLTENLWLLRYPLKLLGADLHRNVTVMRLRSGGLVIHSTGPFELEDVAHINSLGRPGWMLDTMLRHDTFAKRGKEAFPDAVYLAPEGFSEIPAGPLLPTPPEWGDEIEVKRIDGVPSMEEHAVFHRPSRTLIVADLLFNFGPDAPAWTRFLMLARRRQEARSGHGPFHAHDGEGRRGPAPIPGGNRNLGFRPHHRRTRRRGRNRAASAIHGGPAQRRVRKNVSVNIAVAKARGNCYD